MFPPQCVCVYTSLCSSQVLVAWLGCAAHSSRSYSSAWPFRCVLRGFIRGLGRCKCMWTGPQVGGCGVSGCVGGGAESFGERTDCPNSFQRLADRPPLSLAPSLHRACVDRSTRQRNPSSAPNSLGARGRKCGANGSPLSSRRRLIDAPGGAARVAGAPVAHFILRPS